MPLFLKILLIIAIILVVVLVVLTILGKKAEKKKVEQDAQIAAAAQSVSMLIIDKKKMPLKEANLPALVMEQTPKMLRRTKVPIVKAKVGPKIMSFICDATIFDSVPVKKEVKAVISGLYITQVKGLHGPIETNQPKRKKKLREKLLDKYNSLKAEEAALTAEKGKKKKN
ncbi:MAG: hypothetical protein ACI4HI_12645 [Lachnospiraceae bacterium]